ncbi:hypothetical protein [Streptacidiphilus sp. EB129]|jgi:hypothetical protein|uniref:hypothetical protein n=1 Tax=Streptacidiphilus sp. EB129 TaxID=3156262 RepID=UPI0035112E30
MNSQDRADFLNAYTKLLVSAWSDEDFAARLKSEPRAALAEVGLEVQADAQINILTYSVAHDTPSEQEAALEEQIGFWEEGLKTGIYKLHVPDEPQIDGEALSDSDLMSVAGGGCCCCPCCTMTIKF